MVNKKMLGEKCRLTLLIKPEYPMVSQWPTSCGTLIEKQALEHVKHK